MENKQFIINHNKGTLLDENIEKTRLILGSHFKGFYAFLCNYLFKFTENTYTIMLVRRCSVLATWFLTLIFRKQNNTINDNFDIELTEDGLFSIVNKKTKKKNIIINDMFIESSYNFDESYKIVILDDICIHGRHIKHIEEKIRKKIPEKSNSGYEEAVYMLSSDSVFENVKSWWVEIGGIEWKRLSNQMVDFINYHNLPYVSYLNSMIKFNVDFNEFKEYISKLEKNDNLLLKEFNTCEKEKIGKTSIVVIEKETKSFNYERAKCCRIYYNKFTKVLSFIPYVILEPLEYNDINTKFMDYSDSYGSLLKNENHSKFLYRLLNCIASNCYGNYFIQKYIGDIDFEEDFYNTLLFSYGKNTRDIILKKNNNYLDNLNRFGIQKLNDVKDIDDIIDFDEERIIDSTLAKQWLKNEKNACYLMKKEEKIKIEPIITDKAKNVLWDKIISIIGRCDMGMACISIDDRTKEKLIESRMDVGELGVNLMTDKDLFDADDLMNIKTLKKASSYYRDIFF